MSQILVLSVGSDSLVLDTRDLLIRSAGHSAISTTSVPQAVQLFESRDFHLIVLCHTLSRKDCESLTGIVRASGSRIPIVYVSATGLGERIALSDATLDKDPALFLASLADVLSKHTTVRPPAVCAPIDDLDHAPIPAPPHSKGFDRRKAKKDKPRTLNLLVRTPEPLRTY